MSFYPPKRIAARDDYCAHTANKFIELGIMKFENSNIGDRTKWYWTKWHGQNGTDKMARTKW